MLLLHNHNFAEQKEQRKSSHLSLDDEMDDESIGIIRVSERDSTSLVDELQSKENHLNNLVSGMRDTTVSNESSSG